MNEIRTEEEKTSIESPALKRLEALVSELGEVMKASAGEDIGWDRKAVDRMTVLQVAAQTIRKYEELPEGMTLNSLEKSVRELISQRPQNA